MYMYMYFHTMWTITVHVYVVHVIQSCIIIIKVSFTMNQGMNYIILVILS